MNVRPEVRFDKAQFFAWAEHQERRYELVGGRVVMQSNVTLHHARITTNLMEALLKRLDRRQFEITAGDFAVETGDRSIRYADIMVSPRQRQGAIRSTASALVLFEVLSPFSMHVDFHEKLDEYRTLPGLGTYVICAQDEPRAWVWTRSEGVWPPAPVILEGLESALEVPVISSSLPMSEVYWDIPAG